MSDQHHKGVLGCAGDQVIRTPNLDKLAKKGIRFDNCYAAAPLCVPSRMSFLTSRLPSTNRVWSETELPSTAPTMAHVMKLAGYETSLIGRMHFIGQDQRHGFENRPIGEYTARYPGSKPKGGKPWQHYASASAGQFRKGLESSGYGNTFYQHLDEKITQEACNFLENKNNDKEKPFFAVVGYVLPHCPYIAPKETFNYYLNKVDIPEVESSLPQSVQDFRRIRGLDEPPISKERTRIARAAYYALTEKMDFNIGKVLDKLNQTGLDKNTLVIYVSDHGDLIGEHGCWWKSMYYEGSVGVPMIVAGPNVSSQNRVCNQLSSLLDIGPTLFDIVGALNTHSNDGISLRKCIEEDINILDSKRSIISEMVDIRRDTPSVASRMIRTGEWKLWQTYDEKGYSQPAMFNLKNDFSEKIDLSSSLPNYLTKKKLLKIMHKTWSPKSDRIAAENLRKDLVDVIQRYGKASNPFSDDVLEFPNDSLEKDVTIVPSDLKTDLR